MKSQQLLLCISSSPTSIPQIVRKSLTLPNLILTIFILDFLISPVNSYCSRPNIQQILYISNSNYCTVDFDGCQTSSLKVCRASKCQADKNNCSDYLQTSYASQCQKYCCSNYANLNNIQSINSVKMCQQNFNAANIDNLTSIGGYIFIGVVGGSIIITIIIVCICRNRRRAQQYDIQHNQDNQALQYPTTSVDLAQFDLDQQGPYFINTNDSCAICLDTKVNLRTHCNHFYHGECLLIWIKKKHNNPCPLCMSIIYNPVKVYCIECHSGTKLVNICSTTTQSQIKEYDQNKCPNCLKLINQTFCLSEQLSKTNPVQKKQQILQSNSITSNKYNKSQKQTKQQKPMKRRHRKIQNMRKNQEKIHQDRINQIGSNNQTGGGLMKNNGKDI